mmetsp:Transcript_8723/g.14684  ORF Transcript_8723/g.14684 Transcript_8723/m.14684 type:complete len:566 (+) Transcript_8723:180-1877(+)
MGSSVAHRLLACPGRWRHPPPDGARGPWSAARPLSREPDHHAFFWPAKSIRIGLPSTCSPPRVIALSTSSVEPKPTKPMPLNSPDSLSFSHRVDVTVAPAPAKNSVIFSSVIDHGRLPQKISVQPSGFSPCGLYGRCGRPPSALGVAPASHAGFFEPFEKLIRIGRPDTSIPASATALVDASIDSKSMNAVPLNSPSFMIHLMLVISPHSANAARSASSVSDHDRLPTKTLWFGSPGSPLPAKPPGAAALRGAASSIFIGRPSQSLPLSATAAAAAEDDSKVRKPAPLKRPVSACVSHEISDTAPQLAKISFAQSSVMEKGRLPMYTRQPPSSAAGVAVGAGAGAGAGRGQGWPPAPRLLDGRQRRRLDALVPQEHWQAAAALAGGGQPPVGRGAAAAAVGGGARRPDRAARARADERRVRCGPRPCRRGRRVRSRAAAHAEGEAAARLGQPAPGGLDREKVHEPGADAAGPDPGGLDRADQGGREVRRGARLPPLHVRHVVDPAGDHARHRRPLAHDPAAGAHARPRQLAAQGEARAVAQVLAHADRRRARRAPQPAHRQAAAD